MLKAQCRTITFLAICWVTCNIDLGGDGGGEQILTLISKGVDRYLHFFFVFDSPTVELGTWEVRPQWFVMLPEWLPKAVASQEKGKPPDWHPNGGKMRSIWRVCVCVCVYVNLCVCVLCCVVCGGVTVPGLGSLQLCTNQKQRAHEVIALSGAKSRW
jgi:hypothetical protein